MNVSLPEWVIYWSMNHFLHRYIGIDKETLILNSERWSTSIPLRQFCYAYAQMYTFTNWSLNAKRLSIKLENSSYSYLFYGNSDQSIINTLKLQSCNTCVRRPRRLLWKLSYWDFKIVSNAHLIITQCIHIGYWPSLFSQDVFFLQVYGLRWSCGPQTRKNEWGQNSAILKEQAWAIKDLLYGFEGNFTWGTDTSSTILPALVANHNTRFNSSCPITELAIW